MPATITRPVQIRPLSFRQINFLRTLVDERNADTLAPLMNEITLGLQGSEVRSDLIDRVMALPRAVATVASGASRAANATELPTPSDSTRAGRMLQHGGIEATVTLINGQHVTVRVSSRRRVGRGWANCGPTDEGVRTNIQVLGQRVGWVTVRNGEWALSMRTRREHIIAAVNAVFAYAAGEATDGMLVQEASRCGRCYRRLSDPVSIQRGVGPECFGQSTGSRHAAVDGDAAAAVEADLMAATAALTTPVPADVALTSGVLDEEDVDERELQTMRYNAAREQRRQQQAVEAAEAANNAAMQQREREQDIAAAHAEAAEERALGIGADTLATADDVRVARALISGALARDHTVTNDERARALHTFDSLAGI